ncbi:hypothetical protein EPTV-WA-135 [Eptesipox virus]|uniref:Uncharacterized protein n=1 Tax=Eptesipox virus TaxID=1329402 RepID=A0A220T6J7_9POXV|nr:hypothetical protein CG743_gp135 [Eptesipox virus]ASK51336.1 hypothetical protein EPTV-WA-135 [Eptesipox virus]WAH71094.1 hypothetical protein CG743_gp135 [Eptesipox virus]
MEDEKMYETIPYYCSNNEINNDLLMLLHMNITSYYKKDHIDLITKQLYRHYNDIVFVKNEIKIFSTEVDNIVNIKTTENNIICKVIMCINSANKGGLIYMIDNFTTKRRMVHLNKNCFIVVYPNVKVSFTPVTFGCSAIAIIECIIQPLTILYTLTNNVYYTNNLKTILPKYDDEVIFAIKRVTDAITNKIICTQILINKEWYIIVKYNNKKLYFPSICFGKPILNFNFIANINKNDIKDIVNLSFPFNECPYKKSIFGNKVVVEQILFCKIQMKK